MVPAKKKKKKKKKKHTSAKRAAPAGSGLASPMEYVPTVLYCR